MWVHIVPMLGQWAPFLPAGASLGPPWAILEPSWRDHAAISDQFHAILGLLGSLGPSWMHLGENAGPSCGHLETLSDHLGAILRCRTGDIQMLAESALRLGESTIVEVPQGAS